MNKKILVSSFSLLIVPVSQTVFAHNEGASVDFEKREVERETASKKKDSDTWDDFMKSVKAQEVKQETTQETKQEAKTDADKTTAP
ncbi:hypothetical protein MNBD_GAMMA06-1125 [hydrothermal vent metagenome]|uniref:Uncharacterized protein n=1 Tax=hydrothermal vent metagenome TaxID=652676 RepID=A0A3B0WKK4_9ZZZZ